MHTPHDPPENPYAAPQEKLAPNNPPVVYERKFNGRLAFWSGLWISVVFVLLALPAVRGPRSNPPSSDVYISVALIVVAIGFGIGLLLGAISGKPIENPTNINSEEPITDEPKS